MKLIELFDKTFKSLNDIKDEESFVFDSYAFPDIPQILNSDMSVQIRMIRRKFGNVDNLVMTINQIECFYLGLWIIGSHFQRKFNNYILHLNIPDEAGHFIKEFHLEFDDYNNGLNIIPTKFEWMPQEVEQFVKMEPPYFAQRPTVYRTCEHKDFCNCNDWELNILKGFGKIGASFFASEFFLNLGWRHSEIAFEYFKDNFNPSIGAVDSCEMRVELKEAQRYSLEELINQKVN